MQSPSPLDLPPGRTVLAVVDIQDRLLPAMAATQQPVVLKAVTALTALAREAGHRVIVTEQYPRGLGPTVEPLRAPLGDAGGLPALDKTAFSAARARGFAERLADAEVVVLCGMETHVCVLETALDLRARGLRVVVPWDAVASRREEDRATGLQLMRDAGCAVASSESLIFHHLGGADGEAFKRLSKLLR
jgi:nicotinamidase-related amidase